MGNRCERTYMRNKHIIKNLFVVACMVSSLFVSSISAFSVESGDNSAMTLSKVQGTVAVLDKDNKPKKATENMKLINENKIVTNIGSYAWVNIDNNLVKLDSLSKVKIAQSGKNLIVDVNAGKIFVDVSKNPENNEGLLVRSLGVIAIIKDTCAEINVENGNTKIVCLDGKIDCVVTDATTGQLKPVEVLPGNKVEIEPAASKNSVITKAATKNDISGFSKLQIAQDPVLKEKISESCGPKIGNITETEAVNSISQDTIRQVTELVAIAKEAGTDPQSMINAMMGADVRSKTLEQANTSTQTASSDNTPASSSSDKDQSTSNGAASNSEPKHTHNYENTSNTPATCTSTGSRVYSCKGCGDVKTETIPKLAHDYEEISHTDATCTSTGSKVYSCKGCDDVKTETIPKLAHDYEETYNDATCTTDATYDLKCRVCEFLTTETISGSAGHIYADDAETIERIIEGATADNCAEIIIAEYKTCSRCNEEIEQLIRPKYSSHNFVNELSRENATCTESGKITYRCDNWLENGSYPCTFTYTIDDPESPALGHELNDKIFLNRTDACYCLECRRINYTDGNPCGFCSGSYPHTLDEFNASMPPESDARDKYVKCAETGCNIYAKYSWDDATSKYIFTEIWVNQP